MAVPSYTEDLTDLTMCEATTGFSALGGGAAGLGAGVDFAIQGTNAVDKQITGTTVKGMVWDNGATITMGADDHLFIWLMPATPGTMTSLATGGLRVTIGTTTSDYNDYYVQGSDTYPGGGNKCYCVRHIAGTPSPGSQTGTPGANPQWFGGQISNTGTVRGSNFGIDAIRYGTGAYLTAGELISAGDASDDPCTFAGFATQNDNTSNRWGILAAVPGGYALQGRFVVGQNNAGTATLARFADSNTTIFITDITHSLTDFTQIIVDHASTRLEWNNVSILALGTNNPGQLVFNNASSTGVVNGGTYTNIGISTLRAGFTFTGTTWRSTGIITQNGSTLTDCVFDSSTNIHHILSDDPSLISGGDFTFGSGHAVRCDTIGTYNWNGNTDTGYTGTRGSNPTSASGSTDAMFYNNSTGLITLNVGAGGQAPSVRNGTGATTVVNNNVNVTFTGMKDNTEVRIYKTSDDSVVDGIENATTGTTDNRSFQWSAAAALDVYYVIHNTIYETIRVEGYAVPGTDTSLPIQQRLDRNYNNPA